MSDITTYPDPAPGVVLAAREGFIGYMDNHTPTPEELFTYLVANNYLTMKAYIELASGYDAL
jgi:hypothetical protein